MLARALDRLRRLDGPALLAVAALAHVGIFAGLFRGVYSIPYSGTGLYYDYAGKVLAGLLPYRDFVLEYPPLALVFFTLPRVLGESFRWYYVWFQTQVVVADLVAVAALYLAARWWSLPARRVLGAYTIVVLAVGPITLQQYDVFPAVFSLLALLAFARRRDAAAGAFLALGVMTKIYPILLAPLFVLASWRRGRRREIAIAIAAFTAVCVACLLPWLVRAPGSLRVLVSYHTQRGIHIDSSWATVSFIARALGLTWVDTELSFASWNIAGPVPRMLVPVSSVVLLAVLAAAYVWFDRGVARRLRDGRDVDVRFLARASAVVLLGAMAASKVLSPQYLFWPAPFLALVERERERVAIGVFVAIGALTFWVYPLHYDGLLARVSPEIVVQGVRNALIAVLAFLLARRAAPGTAPAAAAEAAP